MEKDRRRDERTRPRIIRSPVLLLQIPARSVTMCCSWWYGKNETLGQRESLFRARQLLPRGPARLERATV